MKLVCRLIMFAISMALAQQAAAGRDEPVKNPSNIPIAWNKARMPAIEEIGRAIVTGCAARGWQCGVTRPGEIRAVLYVRKHMAESRIVFDTSTFAIDYVNSSELMHDATANTIHRKYNLWVANLISDINSAIAAIPE